ncbi:putative fucose kinase [Trypanosoma conorhini]|uniref:Putative fucose kinase n=1 Tax=Trypanosoma conorhini TaxID=83891 RepID=A0A3R7LA46_9TRYP|nr:putative fucose kinase [Trypanosoma conorhini]RNF19289.1 putative fucose kinase [Trypanosoma conorhini]
MCRQAVNLHDAIARGEFERHGGLIGVAWEQRKRLDAEASSAAAADIISRVENDVWVLRLAGADGGCFYMAAKDVGAAQRIWGELTVNPPNATARFVEMGVCHCGIEVKRM